VWEQSIIGLDPRTQLVILSATVGHPERFCQWVEVTRRLPLLLVDSRAQCERLGELQHAASERGRAVEIGAFCAAPVGYDRAGITVADFTGLGAEDLFIAEACAAG
jgi:ornithine cyclodeaminase/alanine dehydrogenase-like protein (mu-crystallin family)